MVKNPVRAIVGAIDSGGRSLERCAILRRALALATP